MNNVYLKLESAPTLDRIVSIFSRKETPAQKMWRQTYGISQKLGYDHAASVDRADAAVGALRERS